jgi:hypothetical protein
VGRRFPSRASRPELLTFFRGQSDCIDNRATLLHFCKINEAAYGRLSFQEQLPLIVSWNDGTIPALAEEEVPNEY